MCLSVVLCCSMCFSSHTDRKACINNKYQCDFISVIITGPVMMTLKEPL